MKGLLGCLYGIIGFVLYAAVVLAVTCLLSYLLCDIEPDKLYTWYSGIWQGLFCIPNWVRSFFDSGVLCKAINYTAGYNFWWWTMFIFSLLSIFSGGSRMR